MTSEIICASIPANAKGKLTAIYHGYGKTDEAAKKDLIETLASVKAKAIIGEPVVFMTEEESHTFPWETKLIEVNENANK